MKALAIILLGLLGGIILLIFFSWIGTKACCTKSFNRSISEAFTFGSKNRLNYAAPGSDEADAQLYQQDWLPPDSELTEAGGTFAQVEGIQSPLLSAKEDPFNDPRSYL